MSNHSIQLAYPDGYTLPSAVKTVFTTGPNTVHDQQAGMYVGIPSISQSNTSTVPICGLIHCSGYSSALIHPVCTATQVANSIAVYGFWGFAESGDTPTRYVCNLITSVSIAVQANTGIPMTSSGGTAYLGMGAVGAPTGGISLAMDRMGPGPAASATATTNISGVASSSSNSTIATLGIPYLNGADYLAILYNADANNSAQHNCYVILTEQERY